MIPAGCPMELFVIEDFFLESVANSTGFRLSMLLAWGGSRE